MHLCRLAGISCFESATDKWPFAQLPCVFVPQPLLFHGHYMASSIVYIFQMHPSCVTIVWEDGCCDLWINV